MKGGAQQERGGCSASFASTRVAGASTRSSCRAIHCLKQKAGTELEPNRFASRREGSLHTSGKPANHLAAGGWNRGCRLSRNDAVEKAGIVPRSAEFIPLQHDSNRQTSNPKKRTTLKRNKFRAPLAAAAAPELGGHFPTASFRLRTRARPHLKSRLGDQLLRGPRVAAGIVGGGSDGKMRISNFLLWQISYADLVLTPTL